MSYYVRKAVPEDLPGLLEIYAAARKIMVKSGNPNQWGSTNPPVETLVTDIEKGQLYLLLEGDVIHGAFALIAGEDPTYRVIYEGGWSREAPYHTIHRLAGDGSGGIFAACIAYCRTRGNYLRIDTHRENKIMLHCLEKAGFTRCGIIYLANGDPRIAFDLEF